MKRKSLLERHLEEQFGNLHDLIPAVCSDKGQEECARLLSEESGAFVSQVWVSRWLIRNGYELRTRYVKVKETI